MVTQDGLQVRLKDLDENVIETDSGKVVYTPGGEFHVIITVGAKFEWFDATHLYVAITSRDDEAKKGWEASSGGRYAQVLCIRRDAPDRTHKITEMKRWIEANSYSGSIDAEKPGPKTNPFKMPPPFAESKGLAYDNGEVPDLEARPGCVQVSFKRGSLTTSGPYKLKQRPSDPPYSTRSNAAVNQQPIRYIDPRWFKTLKGTHGNEIVFQFKNTSTNLGQGEEETQTEMLQQTQLQAPTARMQVLLGSKPCSPADGANATYHDPEQAVAQFPRIPTRTRRYSPGRKATATTTEDFSNEPEADPDNINVADRRTAKQKTSGLAVDGNDEIKTETHVKNTQDVKPEVQGMDTVDDVFYVSSRQVSGSKRGRSPRTPNLSPTTSTRFADATPSSKGSAPPMSSQKKRKLQLLELRLKEVRLERELLELDNEE